MTKNTYQNLTFGFAISTIISLFICWMLWLAWRGATRPIDGIVISKHIETEMIYPPADPDPKYKYHPEQRPVIKPYPIYHYYIEVASTNAVSISHRLYDHAKVGHPIYKE